MENNMTAEELVDKIENINTCDSDQRRAIKELINTYTEQFSSRLAKVEAERDELLKGIFPKPSALDAAMGWSFNTKFLGEIAVDACREGTSIDEIDNILRFLQTRAALKTEGVG